MSSAVKGLRVSDSEVYKALLFPSRLSGRVAVNRSIEVGEPPLEASQRYRDYFTGWWSSRGYFECGQAHDAVSYERTKFHVWQIVVSVLLFPVGLLSLIAEKAHFNVTAVFTPVDGDETAIRLSGVLPIRVAEQWRNEVDRFDPESESEV